MRHWNCLPNPFWNITANHTVWQKIVEKKFDALAKDLRDNFSACARTDTMEVTINSSSTTTDQHSVCDHDLNEIMVALKVWFNEAGTHSDKIQVLILKSASLTLEVDLTCGFSLSEHNLVFSVKFCNCFYYKN